VDERPDYILFERRRTATQCHPLLGLTDWSVTKPQYVKAVRYVPDDLMRAQWLLIQINLKFYGSVYPIVVKLRPHGGIFNRGDGDLLIWKSTHAHGAKIFVGGIDGIPIFFVKL